MVGQYGDMKGKRGKAEIFTIPSVCCGGLQRRFSIILSQYF